MNSRPIAVAIAVVAALAVALGQAGGAGARNPQIVGLQVALRAYGLYGGQIDAIAGPLTVEATKAFQHRAGIPVTGRPDLRTRVSLGPVGGPLLGRRVLRPKMFGWDVAVLQFLLTERGLSRGPINGWFDRFTLVGIRRFQKSLGLEPDGVVGRTTLLALAELTGVPLAIAAKPVPRKLETVAYVVRPGDSLTLIASRAGTTPGAVARLNRMRLDDILALGRNLRLPPSAIRHVSDRVSG